MNRFVVKLRKSMCHLGLMSLTSLLCVVNTGCTEDEWDFGQRVEPVRPITVTYVNVNEVNPLYATLYKIDGKPFFTHVILSTAFVTTDDNQSAILSFSDKVKEAMQQTSSLHESGLKVLLSITGSGCGLGFANMTDKQIETFGTQIKAVVDQYDLDGIDFNDENAEYGMYGFPPANSTSYSKLIETVRKLIGTEKLITVYDNSTGYSRHLTSVAQLVDYAWSDKFGQQIDPRSRIGLANWQYCGYSQKLNLNFADTDTYTVQQVLRRFQESNMGALMFFDLRRTPQDYSIPGQYEWQPPTEYTVTTEDVRKILERTAKRIFGSTSTVDAPEDTEFYEW